MLYRVLYYKPDPLILMKIIGRAGKAPSKVSADDYYDAVQVEAYDLEHLFDLLNTSCFTFKHNCRNMGAGDIAINTNTKEIFYCTGFKWVTTVFDRPLQ